MYGVLDSINYPAVSELPAPPVPVQRCPSRCIAAAARRVASGSCEQIGMDEATFSIEYFYDPETDEINLLEINPRHSQSHAELFEYVDGVTQPPLHAQPRAGPRTRHCRAGKGPYAVAAKWYYRWFADGIVHERAHRRSEIARLERDIPGVRIEVVPEEGQRLSDRRRAGQLQLRAGAHLHRRRRARTSCARSTTGAVAALRSRASTRPSRRAADQDAANAGRSSTTKGASHSMRYVTDLPARSRKRSTSRSRWRTAVALCRPGSGGPTVLGRGTRAGRPGVHPLPQARPDRPSATRSTTPTSPATATPACASTCAAPATPRACSGRVPRTGAARRRGRARVDRRAALVRRAAPG